MKSKFLNTCVGIAIVLLAAGFFIRSFSAVNATPTISKKIMVQGDAFSAIGIANDNAYYFSFDGNGFATLKKAPLSSAEQ